MRRVLTPSASVCTPPVCGDAISPFSDSLPITEDQGIVHGNRNSILEESLEECNTKIREQRFTIESLKQRNSEQRTEIERLRQSLQREQKLRSGAHAALHASKLELLRKEKEIQVLKEVCFDEQFGSFSHLEKDGVHVLEEETEEAKVCSGAETGSCDGKEHGKTNELHKLKKLRLELATVKLEKALLTSEQEELHACTISALTRHQSRNETTTANPSVLRTDVCSNPDAANACNQRVTAVFHAKYLLPLKQRKLELRAKQCSEAGEYKSENWDAFSKKLFISKAEF